MHEYVMRIAELDDIVKRMNYLIKIHPDNNIWVVAKENAIRGYYDKSRIMYIGTLNGEIICEATAYIKEEAFEGDILETDDLLSDKRAYLCAFRTNKEYQRMGYFSKLYRFMERDLKRRGYKELCLGVEPMEVINMQIYFMLGFTNYIKTTIEYLPPVNEDSEPEPEVINYYYKKI